MFITVITLHGFTKKTCLKVFKKGGGRGGGGLVLGINKFYTMCGFPPVQKHDVSFIGARSHRNCV